MSSLDPVASARVAKAHRTYILNARKAMDYLRAHPGATNAEVYAAVGHSVNRLCRMGVAKSRRENGVTRWYLTGEVARPKEESKLEEAERENEGVRWTTYRNV